MSGEVNDLLVLLATPLALEEIDAAVTMGCGDACPPVKAARRFDWKIPDTCDMRPAEFRQVRDLIREKVQALLAELSR
jgi:arsenate reductase (thioredoxin)